MKNRSYEARMMAPRLVADRTKYIAFVERIPRLAHTDLEAPRRMPCDNTNKTAGPGVTLSTASVSTKRNQVSKFIFRISPEARTGKIRRKRSTTERLRRAARMPARFPYRMSEGRSE